jgi:hypothetical protein
MGERTETRDRGRATVLEWRGRPIPTGTLLALAVAALLLAAVFSATQAGAPAASVPINQRGTLGAERAGTHDANNIRTVFWNYGMVGDYPADPGGVDLSVFHSVEVPKGSGMNYSDGITPFVLAKIRERNGRDSYIMETGFRERQATSPNENRMMRLEPRPGYFQADPLINVGRSPAISNDPRTWPTTWPDRLADPDDPGWGGQWNGYFGKRPAADQESFTVMDDDYYEGWDFYPDSTDLTRKGLGLRIEVRGFQWANPQAGNVIFWHYDITNEGTTDYDDNIIFGLYMDSGVGGSALSCDGIYESDDDNAYFDRAFDEKVINLVYTWDRNGHGRDLQGNCSRTGYLGYAYLETPGNSFDRIDNDEDGITDEKRDGGPGERIVGRDAIREWITAHYDFSRFTATYGPLEKRPAYRAGVWWTGDEDADWVAELHDTGADGVPGTGDTGELDGIPTEGEPNFDRTDLHESDQIGLTGFKMNRIKPGQGNPNSQVDDILFFTNGQDWPHRLYEQFTDPDPARRFDPPLASNYNIGFLFASGPFSLKAGKSERFSLSLAYGGDLDELRRTVQTVQTIYNANYQFAVPPPMPTLNAETGDGFVRLSWDDVSERGVDPVSYENDFEGYRVYRSTDPEFRDPRVITTGTGSGPIGNGRPIAQFDLVDGKQGFSPQSVEGVSYYLGRNTGITHTWTDSTVTNGQEYFYALCAYDYGSDSLGFYPSENAIAVSRTPRGGTILPKNVVQVRPEPKALGYTPASTDAAAHAAGDGSGTVDVAVVNSAIVPDDHLFRIGFAAASPDSVLANAYSLTDSTDHRALFRSGRDFHAGGTGPVGEGLLPLVNTIRTTEVDSTHSGFVEGSPTNARIKVGYLTTLPLNLRRVGFPDDIEVRFADQVADTSLPALGLPAKPAKFRVWRQSAGGEAPMDFRFRDLDNDGTLSQAGEYIDIVTYLASQPTVGKQTWRAQLDTLGQAERGAIRPPAGGDVYQLRLRRPLGVGDVFLFTTRGHRVDETKAREAPFTPYVVPNPYVAAASFEPERFAVSGRGDRRMEFRGLPASCTIRIYTVRGELVRTLEHAGGNDGFVPWDLRTRDNLDVAPGLYIFHVDAGPLGTSIGKFAIVK